MKRTIIIWVMLALLPLVFADNITTGTVINTTTAGTGDINLSINISGTVFFSTVVQTNESIYFSSMAPASANVPTVSLNFTDRNKSYVLTQSSNTLSIPEAFNYSYGTNLNIKSDVFPIAISGLSLIGNKISVTRDGTLISTSAINTYTIPDALSYTFSFSTAGDVLSTDVNPSLIDSLLSIVDWFSVFVIIIIGGLILVAVIAFKNKDNWSFESIPFDKLPEILVWMFVVMMVIIITILVLNVMGGM